MKKKELSEAAKAALEAADNALRAEAAPLQQEPDGEGEEDLDLAAEAAEEGESQPYMDKLVASVASLTDKLLEARADSLAARTQLATLTPQLAALEASQEGLRAIVVKATQRCLVALGGSPVSEDSLKALAPALLIEQYNTAAAMEAKRFGAGGRVSSGDSIEDTDDVKVMRAAKDLEASIFAPLSKFKRNSTG